MEITLRKAVKTDIPQILDLIKELALYERAPQEVTITSADLEKDGFSENPIFEVILSHLGDQLAGMAGSDNRCVRQLVSRFDLWLSQKRH